MLKIKDGQNMSFQRQSPGLSVFASWLADHGRVPSFFEVGVARRIHQPRQSVNPGQFEIGYCSDPLALSSRLKSKSCFAQCPGGEIGRHSRLKICRRLKASYRFDSGPGHQISSPIRHNGLSGLGGLWLQAFQIDGLSIPSLVLVRVDEVIQ